MIVRTAIWGVVSIVGVAAFIACVGDDPGGAPATENDGGTGSETSTPADATPDTSTLTDSGSDACTSNDCNPKSCGDAGRDCLGGTCLKGKCQPVTLATNQKNPGTIIVSLDRVFWVNQGECLSGKDGSIGSVNIDGTGFVTLAQGLDCPTGIAAYGTKIYWVEAKSIHRMNRDGSLPEELMPFVDAGATGGFAIDSTGTMFYTVRLGTTGTMYRAPAALDAGGSATAMIAIGPTPNHSGFFVETQDGGAYVYYTEDSAGNVYRVDKTATVGQDAGKLTIATGDVTAGTVISTPEYVFWADRDDGIFKRYDRGTTLETTLVTTNVFPGAKVRRASTDDTHVYVTGGYNAVLRFRHDGGVNQHEVVSGTAAGANGIFATNDAIYLTYYSAVGTVVKLAKP